MLAGAFVGLAVVLTLMTLVWVVSLIKSDVSIIDPMWGIAFLALALAYVWWEEPTGSRVPLLLILVGAWSLRLFGYLAWRKAGEPEDYRYQKMRERGGSNFPVMSLFKIFWLQAALAWVISAPLMAVARTGEDAGALDYIGVVVWASGLFFEAVGDYQLARFKADPSSEGRVMDRGLWAYTRHPNYFGDFLVWWGYYLIALSAGGWWSIYGPVLMTVLLIKVSGVSLLEKKLESSRTGYKEYAARTNAFFPGPRRASG